METLHLGLFGGSVLPPIHLGCGFHPLSLDLREGGKDEKKNPLESQ